MAKDDDDDDSLPPLGDKTEAALEDVKKGKSRNFLLLSKGGKVKYLVVQKKPIKSVAVVEAKKLGYKGEAYFGLLTKQGPELCFNLQIPDNDPSLTEDSPGPVIDSKLKGFLEDHTSLKVKATFKWVREFPAVPFDEEDLNDPLIARFVRLTEQVSKALDLHPEATAELESIVSRIRVLLGDEQTRPTAEPKINALESRLGELIRGTSTPSSTSAPSTLPESSASSTPPNAAPAVDPAALKSKLQEALNKLVPQLKQAVATYPERKVELLTPVAQIKSQMDAGDLQNARQGILAVGQLLKSVLAQGGNANGNVASSQPPNDLQAEYERKLATVQPNYDRGLREQLGDTSKFRTVMTYALEQAAAGVYANAIKALDRLGPAIEQAIAAARPAPQPNTSSSEQSDGSVPSNPRTVPVSKVALQQSILAWDEARKRAQSDVAVLEQEILALFANDARLAEVQQNVHKLEAVLGDYAQNLRDQLDDAYNAPDEFKGILCNEALGIVHSYRTYLGTDPFIRAVANNQLKPLDIEGVLGKTLDVLAKNLAG